MAAGAETRKPRVGRREPASPERAVACWFAVAPESTSVAINRFRDWIARHGASERAVEDLEEDATHRSHGRSYARVVKADTVADRGENGAAADSEMGEREVEHETATASLDRDLSWLEFNRRVLREALDERTPLLERVKFVAIFTSNLDEFFMKRMALIRPHDDPSPRGRQSRELLVRAREAICAMLTEQAECYSEVLRPRLAQHGVHLLGWDDLSERQRASMSSLFDTQISPVLTPLSLDAAHPFPFISNLSTSWTFRLSSPASGDPLLVRVKVPRELEQWLEVDAEAAQERVFVSLEDVVAANAHKLFPGLEIASAGLVRVCRDAEVDLDDDGGSKRALVEREVQQRRFEPVVRLEVQPRADPEIVAELMNHFRLTSNDVYELPALLDYTTLFEIAALDIPELREPPWTPIAPRRLDPAHGDIFSAIQAGDVLVHHPYESFDASVERFIAEAADDPSTASIKMTVYRVGDDTPFVRSLIRAAEAGKQVACVIELSARFDEERNLHWSRELENAGAHVVFGVTGLKTHSKTALVVRREEGVMRCYAHVATGNYHVRTARLYEDIGLLTVDPAVTRDVVTLFHFLTGHSETPSFETLLIAPLQMRSEFRRLVENEIENCQAGRPARIVGKMNQLEDPEMCALLARASQAGVPVDLIVRGLCCLAPDVPGVTDNVRIRSVVGRFLEHSRIYHFAAGSDDPLDGEFLIGSADLMHRNLSNRVEAVVPIRARNLRRRLWEILEICLADRRNAWQMQADGTYAQLFPDRDDDAGSEGTHAALMRLTLARHGV
jgi:polyphosphate kinase